MASKSPDEFGLPFSSFPHAAFQSSPMYQFPQHELTITEALQLSKVNWTKITQHLEDLNNALTKLLGKNTSKPTLEKILTSWTEKEKRNLLSEQETQILAIFLRTVDRLEQVKNAIPIGALLKERPDINAILSRTAVHSVVHEDIADAVKKGTTVSSRFRATISVIPRLLNCLYPLVETPEERTPADAKNSPRGRKRARSSPSSTQQSDATKRSSSSREDSAKEMPSKKNEQPGRSNVQDETQESRGFYFREQISIEEEFLIGNPDFEFQRMMSVDDLYNMQRKAHFQKIYAKKCAENHQLSKENTALLQLIQENEKEIEDLKKQKGSKSDGPSSGAGDDTKPVRKKQRKDQMDIISDLLKRVQSLEASQSSISPDQSSSATAQNHSHTLQNQLDEHLKYFHRRLAEIEPSNQTDFTYNSTNFAAGYFDERGGFLEIVPLKVSLFVPPGAIKPGSKSEIYIFVDTDQCPQSGPGKDRTILAPVVQCGPPGTQFQESVVLSFPHCADEEDNWTFQPMTCQSDENHQENGQWNNLTMDDAICMVEKGRTILMVNHFTLYTLTGEKKDDDTIAKKKMRVGAFGSSFSSEQESYKFRVRAWDDTEAALEQVLKKEERLSGQQLDDDRPVTIASTGEPMDVTLKNVKAGWKNRYHEPNGQQISFDDLWQPSSLPSCTFNLEVAPEVDTTNRNNNSENNIDHKLKSGVHCQVNLTQHKSNDSPIKLKIDVHEKPKGDVKCETFSGAVQEKIFGPFDPTSGLSQKAYYELCEHLNIEKGVLLLDWRSLADKLGCNFMTIENIKANKKEEPAKLVLKVFFSMWKATGQPGSAIQFLKKTLKELGLGAAVKVIEDDLDPLEPM